MSEPAASVDRAGFERAVARLDAADARLEHTIAALTDAQARATSALPGWTVGHVLTHLARNADAARNMVEAACRGEVGEQYPAGAYANGWERRAADIDAGADRPADVLVADVVDSARLLSVAWRDLDDVALGGHGDTLGGARAIVELPQFREREVEVHHVDLALGYGFDQWPSEFVREELRKMTMRYGARHPMGVVGLPERALAQPPARRLAWLFGRVTIDGLDPAGIY